MNSCWKKERKDVWKQKADNGNFVWINKTPSNKYVVMTTNGYPLSPKLHKFSFSKSNAIKIVDSYMKHHC